MYTSRLLLASTILIVAYADCNYASFADYNGYREALDLCFSMDLFDHSFKFVHNTDDNMVQEHIYDNKECSGDSVLNREAPADALHTETGNTCSTFSYVSTRILYDDAGQVTGVKDRDFTDFVFDAAEPAYVWMNSILYDDCILFFGDFNIYAKVTSCQHNAEGSGKDVLSHSLYSDNKCTQQLAGETWFDAVNVKNEKGEIVQVRESWIANTVHEEAIWIQFRDKATQNMISASSAQDITCYKEQVKPAAVVFGGPQESDTIGRATRRAEYPDRNSPLLPPNTYERNHMHFPQVPKAPPADWNPPRDDTNWSYDYLAVNVLVSGVSTLCVVAVCLTAYYWMKRKSGLAYGPLQWTKDVDTEV